MAADGPIATTKEVSCAAKSSPIAACMRKVWEGKELVR
jgi:hypothetical protein